LKRLTDITLYTEPTNIDSEVFRLALAGNDLCQVNTVDDVRRIVRWLAPSRDYDRCYIRADYSDGTCEIIPPDTTAAVQRPFVFMWDNEDLLPAT
jgi:hypothetical protein